MTSLKSQQQRTPITNNERLREQFPLLSQSISGKPLIYFDNASTTPMPKQVIDTLVDFEVNQRANVGRSAHSLAMKATESFLKAKQECASFLNGKSDEIIFTSGATAAINTLAQALASNFSSGDEIILSVSEHHSNLLPWQKLAKEKQLTLKFIPLDENFRLKLCELNNLITTRTKLIAITHASNVTGAITDFDLLNQYRQNTDIELLVDGSQMAAHSSIDVHSIKADYYAFSGHKCFGPNGVGVLWIKQNKMAKLTPAFVGGGMVGEVNLLESDYAEGSQAFYPGTPPISQAIALAQALQWRSQLNNSRLEEIQLHYCKLIIDALSAIDGIHIIGPKTFTQRLPIISFYHDDFHSHDLCHLLDEQGVALRGGHHCAQPLLKAAECFEASRISLSIYNTEQEVHHCIEAIKHAIGVLS